MACRWETGNRPWTNDALTILVRYSRKTSINSRTKNVGTALREHDLTGDVIVMRRTSAGVHGRKEYNDVDAWLAVGRRRWRNSILGTNVINFPCKERRKSIVRMAGIAGHIAVTAEQCWQLPPQLKRRALTGINALKSVQFLFIEVSLVAATYSSDPQSIVIRLVCTSILPPESAIFSSPWATFSVKPRFQPPTTSTNHRLRATL